MSQNDSHEVDLSDDQLGQAAGGCTLYAPGFSPIDDPVIDDPIVFLPPEQPQILTPPIVTATNK